MGKTERSKWAGAHESTWATSEFQSFRSWAALSAVVMLAPRFPCNFQHSTISSQLFPSLGSAHCGGDAFPFRRQAGKIVGQSGEIAIDRSGAAARCVSGRIFQRRGKFFLLSFQRRDFRLEFVHALFFFTLGFGNRITRLRLGAFLRFLLAQANSAPRRVIGYRLA